MLTNIHAVMEDANYLNSVVQNSVENIVATVTPNVIGVVAWSEFFSGKTSGGVCSDFGEGIIEELFVSLSLLTTPCFLGVFQNVLEVAACLWGDVKGIVGRHKDQSPNYQPLTRQVPLVLWCLNREVARHRYFLL